MISGSTVLFIGKVWPEPNSSAAGSRMIQLVQSLLDQKALVYFASAASKSEYSYDMSGMGVQEQSIQMNDPSFDEYAKSLDPDIVIFDRFMTEEQFGWRVAQACPNALRVLDTEDLHCLRYARQEAWKQGVSFHPDMLYNEHALREIASILRCDLSLIISSYEMELLQDEFEIDPALLIHLPFMLEALTNKDINSWAPYDKREHFISIGNFLHEPNWNAVCYLKESIWPLIRARIPEAQLHIYGSYSSQKVEQLHKPSEGFLVKGRADDAKEVIGKAKVLLAPIRFGAGLKGKLIDAMLTGTPSVTTEIGAEAMHGNFDWPGSIAGGAQAFADEAVTLYNDSKNWLEAQEAIIPILVQLYDRKTLSEKWIRRLEYIMSHIKAHRKQNFIGQILQHHTNASTKYMSKWIEAKNA